MVKDNKSGLFIVAIVAVVALVALFLMVKSSQQTTDGSEEVVVVDDDGNVVGMAFWNKVKEKPSFGRFNSLKASAKNCENGFCERENPVNSGNWERFCCP